MTTTNPAEALPRFTAPPVVETAVGVLFRPMDGWISAHHGVFWDRYCRKDFPKLEERPPVEDVNDWFGAERGVLPAIRWRISDHPETPRLWAASEDGAHVIQIQRNGLFANWIKAGSGAAYRPYAERRQEFRQRLEQLEQYCREQGIGDLEPTTWYVTYVNQIDASGGSNVGQAIGRTFVYWANHRGDGSLPEPDFVALNVSFPVPCKEGRLSVHLTPIVLPPRREHALRLDLTARGQLETRDIDSALSGIDLGHEWVLRAFATLTRSEMHRAWGRVQ